MHGIWDKNQKVTAQEIRHSEQVVGLDVGSVYVSAVRLGTLGGIEAHAYKRHRGKILETVLEILDSLVIDKSTRIAKTGSGSERLKHVGPFIDPIVAMLDGAKHIHPELRNIIYVGAGSFHLIQLNDRGEYLCHSSNTACASGTGAFIDQQALRVGSTPEEFRHLACNAKRCPGVAARCAVFAKTDIIHLQQSGFGTEDIAAGICKSMAESTLDVLLKGKKLQGPTVIIGGVALNSVIVGHMEKRIGAMSLEVEHPELIGAIGAALHAQKEGRAIESTSRIKAEEPASKRLRRPALKLLKSNYPDFTYFFHETDENDTELALPELPPAGRTDVVIGIDIGSTSTKCVVADRDGKPIITAYRKTGGDPVRATQFLLGGIRWVRDKFELELNITGVGTTGSGRKFVKAVIGADLEMNEITSHARAATHIDPNVDTILEIGGQDAKFTQLSSGAVQNSVMNHVCAAGTGSFVEEQATKLGIPIQDYGDCVLNVAPPKTSDRCTVFMERDLDVLLTQGWRRDEVAAAVLYSVCDNYLNKVVAGQHIGERVYFQGATARNKALIAAFEQTLGKSITVSRFCHLTGAWGMAFLLLDKKIEKTGFRGLDFADSEISTRTETCELCRNLCELTVLDLEDEQVGWGMKCGREYSEHVFKKTNSPGFELFRKRRKLVATYSGAEPESPRATIGLPRSLTTHGYMPLWGTLLRSLGMRVKLSPKTDMDICRLGQEVSQAEFCLPIIAGHGHVMKLLDSDCDYVFLPHMIRAPKHGDEIESFFCPYVQGYPSIIQALNATNGHGSKILNPVIELQRDSKEIARRILEAFPKKLGLTLSQVHKALVDAMAAQESFDREFREAGAAVLAELERDKMMGVVVFGRPYNIHDPGITVNLAEKIADTGVTAIPVDAIPEMGKDVKRWDTMYWTYGHKIMRAAEYVVDSDHLFGIYFSNFSCGPDSYITTYFKTIMDERDKPFLSVQFDAHGADAGYITRVEAALESFKTWKPTERRYSKLNSPANIDQRRVIFVPPMGDIGVQLFAAAFEGDGYRAVVLEENEESLDIGYKHVRGGECVPCPSTIGSFIQAVERMGLNPDEASLFMPTADGPCRFGQYHCLDRMILDKKGWNSVNLISPTSANSYSGFSRSLRVNLYRAILCGDILSKMKMKTRPYEEIDGVTDLLAEQSIRRLAECFRNGEDQRPALEAIVREFSRIVTLPIEKPKVGIVGEIYVRNSQFLNQDAVGWIEQYGGEALRCTIGEWILYTSYMHKFNTPPRQPLKWLKSRMLDVFYHRVEHELYDIAKPMLHDRMEPPLEDVIKLGRQYLPVEFQGESILTIGRTLYFIKEEGVSAVANLSPNFCMPGTTTTSILARIEEETGVPIISNFYDGSGEPNKVFRPYLMCLKQQMENGVDATYSAARN